jgi:acyl carrier protein
MVDQLKVEMLVADQLGLPVETLQTETEYDFEHHYGVPAIMLVMLTRRIESEFDVKIINPKRISVDSPEKPTRKNPIKYVSDEDQAVRTMRQIFDAVGVE